MHKVAFSFIRICLKGPLVIVVALLGLYRPAKFVMLNYIGLATQYKRNIGLKILSNAIIQKIGKISYRCNSTNKWISLCYFLVNVHEFGHCLVEALRHSSVMLESTFFHSRINFLFVFYMSYWTEETHVIIGECFNVYHQVVVPQSNNGCDKMCNHIK